MKHFKLGGFIAALGLILWAVLVLGSADLSMFKSNPGEAEGPTPTPTPDKEAFASATSAMDLSEFFYHDKDVMYYSECEDYEDLKVCFDIMSYDTFIKVDHNGKEYLLIKTSYSDYKSIATKLNSVEKRTSGKQLIIDVDLNLEYKANGGCAPWSSPMFFIMENDGDYEYVTVMNEGMRPYPGGYVKILGKTGLLDKDMNFLIRPVYDKIVPVYDDIYMYIDEWNIDLSKKPNYYYVYEYNVGGGLLNSDFEQVLSQKYFNIYCLEPNRFLVGVDNKSEDITERYKIELIDAEENVIRSIDGMLGSTDDSRMYCCEGQTLFCAFVRTEQGSESGKGVIDVDLNIIIPPEYEYISWGDSGYSVFKSDGSKALFSRDGRQLTDFTKD